jgi:hypothetical protein
MKSNVLHVQFRKPAPLKRKGLAFTFSAGDGCVYLSADLKNKRLSLRAVNELIENLEDVRDDAKERRPKRV